MPLFNHQLEEMADHRDFTRGERACLPEEALPDAPLLAHGF
jgi:hypothetical protein